jgi:hypothetical protein
MKPIYVFWPQNIDGAILYTLLSVFHEQKECFTFVRQLDGSIDSGESREGYDEIMKGFGKGGINLFDLPQYGWR